MPQLRNDFPPPPFILREEMPLNAWDSFAPWYMPLDGAQRLRLFVGTNHNNLYLSNQQATNQIVGNDQYAVVLNWYARTTIGAPGFGDDQSGFQRAWYDWTNLTIVTFVVGNSPICDIPLSDLLQRRVGQELLGGCKLAVIPPRQTSCVLVSDEISARMHLLERLPNRGEFRAIWVHLEGIAQRWAE